MLTISRFSSLCGGALCAAIACTSFGQCDNPAGCLIAHTSPGCNNPQCCEAVCTFDAFCCQVEWDALCVEDAYGVCFDCGFELSGSCYQLSEPACNNATCCTTVCAVEPTCCEFVWDTFCIANAVETCAGCGAPGSGSCFEVHEGIGCGSADCCAVTCAADPYCCETFWDGICVSEAFDYCLEPCAADLTEDAVVNAADLGLLLGAWGPSPVGDIDLDADTDAADLGLLLGAWGPCVP